MKKGLNNNKHNYNFMNIQDRRILYFSVGFLGGMILLNYLVPKTLFVIIGSGILGYLGYKLAG